MSELSKPSMARGILVALVAIVSLLCITSIAILASDVRRAIHDQATASSDNTQWTLSQLNVEYFQLREAVASALMTRDGLAELRKRYDILYSRTTTLTEGGLSQKLRSDPEFAKGLTNFRQFMLSWTHKFDGSDDALMAALPQFQADLEAMRNDVKIVPLAGIKIYAQIAEGEREKISQTLIAMAVLTAVMIVFLIALVAILLRFDSANRARAIELSQSLTRTAAIVDTAFDAVVVVDAQGRCIEFNPAAERIFGIQRAEAIGVMLEEMILPKDQHDAHRLTLVHVNDAGRGQGRFTAMRRQGERFPIEISIAHSTAADHSNYVYFMRDLSAEVASKRELLQARDEALAGEKAKADLLAVMSHEMRTPLNGMLGMLELVTETPLTPKQKKLLSVMRSSGDLLLRHVNDVLSISRLESGKMPVQLVPTDLRALVQDVFDTQIATSEANGNRLILSPSLANLPPLLCDNFQIRQVLLNLIGNAIKFTENGVISVEADYSTLDQILDVRVLDTGIGIAEKDIERIFEDFVTLDTSYARAADGTGLGLGITRRIVESLGGSIVAESELGKGSLFRLRLPMAVSQIKPTVEMVQPASPPVLPSVKPCSVLVVEDNAINRLVVREMLEKQGHHVHEAHDGEQGVHMAAITRYDLIFMDISMPKMDGVAAATAIRSGQGLSCDAPIIALTAHAMGAEIARFKAAGMQDVLIKPVTGASLAHALEGIAPAGPMPDEALLAPDVIDELFDIMGADRTRNLMQRFINQTDEAICQIAMNNDPKISAEALRADIHKICGSAAMFGAKTLNLHLRQLEELCRAGDIASVFAQWPQVQTTWRQTCVALRPYLQDHA